ncbi:MAG TPA: tetratricopeptide repeat protein, partial [Anaerolineae bacterium]|nr:tetratricopeptide repeat protein [Anaerolineae bacterium]
TTLMLLHGFVDVLFYFSRVLPLMFIPIGLTISALEPFTPLPVGRVRASRRTWLLGTAGVGLVLVCAILFFLMRRDMLIAQAYANLGALRQAQLEVPQINFPYPTPEQVRLSTDLSSAEELYRAALHRDPNNRTANMRLGLIALDQFDFQEAVNRLQVAHASDPNDYAVNKALGYAYVGTGQLDQAAPLLRQVPDAVTEINSRLVAWRKLGKPELIEYGQTMIRRLKAS